MVLLRFILSAIAVIAGGIAAARFGDVVAVRTRLGRLLFGTVLLAAGTSLPELIAGFDAVRLGIPDLAAGNLLGSTMVNMLFLGLLDIATVRTRMLHRVAITQGLTAALATLMIAVATLFIFAPPGLRLIGVSLDGVILVAIFVVGTRLIQLDARINVPVAEAEAPAPPQLSLAGAILGFAAAVVLLAVAAPVLVSTAEDIAGQTGVAVGFIGVALFPLVTASPELLSSITAVRIGAVDLAVGNLFGSCVFNMTSLALVSLFFGPGSFFGAISPGFVAVGLLGLVLVNVALLGTLTRLEFRILGIEWDALLIILIYVVGVYLLFREDLLLVRRP